MNVQIDQLVKSLLEKDSLENCSMQEVKEYADRHPHFGAAQLLLTKKLQIEKAEDYQEQLQKTITFFHNPLWVKKILNDTGNASVIENMTEIPEPILEETTPSSLQSDISDMSNSLADPISDVDATELSEVLDNESSIALPAFTFEPVEPSKNDLLFEPFHTVDYFASQGINFKEEEKPADKFGKQLRSFTDWLKTMKKLPVTDENQSEQPIAEKKVEQLAEHSLKEREIVTISMAEVWEKQGNKVKAIDIYNKLSLLDPAKSTYFAAKIEALKKTN